MNRTPYKRIAFICRGGYFRSQTMKNIFWKICQEKKLYDKFVGEALGLHGSCVNLEPSSTATELSISKNLPWPTTAKGLNVLEIGRDNRFDLIVCTNQSVYDGLIDLAEEYLSQDELYNLELMTFHPKMLGVEDVNDFKMMHFSEKDSSELEEIYNKCLKVVQKLFPLLESRFYNGDFSISLVDNFGV